MSQLWVILSKHALTWSAEYSETYLWPWPWHWGSSGLCHTVVPQSFSVPAQLSQTKYDCSGSQHHINMQHQQEQHAARMQIIETLRMQNGDQQLSIVQLFNELLWRLLVINRIFHDSSTKLITSSLLSLMSFLAKKGLKLLRLMSFLAKPPTR